MDSSDKLILATIVTLYVGVTLYGAATNTFAIPAWRAGLWVALIGGVVVGASLYAKAAIGRLASSSS